MIAPSFMFYYITLVDKKNLTPSKVITAQSNWLRGLPPLLLNPLSAHVWMCSAQDLRAGRRIFAAIDDHAAGCGVSLSCSRTLKQMMSPAVVRLLGTRDNPDSLSSLPEI
ncbi:hypothetical protein JOB18_035136 [Solea senegalensis]|uniref:Uncharacterized protein n=1 Tax=Solea senegalensis TaxID=28829 RepID=A0AAV6QNS7_SOLSE|nr:hypothetical protein JOB18_035136 [Solea senegalensis]